MHHPQLAATGRENHGVPVFPSSHMLTSLQQELKEGKTAISHWKRVRQGPLFLPGTTSVRVVPLIKRHLAMRGRGKPSSVVVPFGFWFYCWGREYKAMGKKLCAFTLFFFLGVWGGGREFIAAPWATHRIGEGAHAFPTESHVLYWLHGIQERIKGFSQLVVTKVRNTVRIVS
ncbi:uncharacterized protein TEOVI_000754500 [Trypanosoma equiperdum]|uniref:Uncharacterized protein n=1 Tax=Trypanosoma equiperdum TaxID=5694 RepID=A0A1G4HYQ7_TRYEQ|nr:hypothetical protein, conserved [Trypanosoma equiperdum]